ncbi:enoyl-CoA hydratase/isomerase family protein [Mycobacterium bourgelatii]|uniref:Putative enoyl-CoA hydratase/isomerase n=1 Tax=Mycobacterium bourgelatii TaxID=1273442 RepID=A0A7I9YIQ1_MYCBU|nr:enoyl-CoA hydratase-related protein [Mycobacterium bourgelatii]MCV6975568.1 enoyl-CoA hydratase/isomerase family protein [Mycobacterium bourgelatii]GFG88561.1 putative enoyl-CoA hydratase/isomerase [Mycobacterium bourgelatii]
MTTDTEVPTAAISYAVDENVAAIVLDRPGASNALDRVLKEGLLEALTRAGSDPAVRAVALTASGRNFCVGQDLAEHVAALRADPAHAMDTVAEHYNPIVLALNAIEVPVVVGINGACVGAGLGIALAADIRVAGCGAKFGTAFCGIGLASDSGLSASLARLVGQGRATGLFLLGDTIDADTAQAWGLVHRVVPDADLAAETVAVARRLAAGPTAAFKAVKRLLTANADAELPEVLAREAEAQRLLGASTDHIGAVEAFVAKQRPTFMGS